MKAVTNYNDHKMLAELSEDELYEAAKQLQAPYELVKYVHENGKLPVVNFAADVYKRQKVS